MATSAFKSTTKRTLIRAGTTSEDSGSSARSLRRSRSLSRFSRPIRHENENENTNEPPMPDYSRTGPRGKFVNTRRGSSAFPEISLDDLALEFFGSSSWDESEKDAGGREGRSIRRWASDTASSTRRGRSVSRSRGDAFSSGSASERKKPISSSSNNASRRRRSLSVARRRISDFEGEVDNSWSSSNHANVKVLAVGNSPVPLGSFETASNSRRLGRSRSHKNISLPLDECSSYSSALTDDESKDNSSGRNGMEKIIRAVYAQKKAENPTEDVGNGGLYEAMRKELKCAINEIRTELNQAMGRNQTALSNGDCLQMYKSEISQDFPSTKKSYVTKLEQLEKEKQSLLTEMLIEEQGVCHSYTTVNRSPQAKISTAEEKPSRARKRSSDRNWVSKRLTEEAERYFEGFISNVDTDISSLDGERSDGSLTLGRKERNGSLSSNEPHKTPVESMSSPIEMDGVYFPWLQWETSHDGSRVGKSMQTPVTPKTLYWDSEKDVVPTFNPGTHSGSSHGSCSLSYCSSPVDKSGATSISKKNDEHNPSRSDMDVYLKLPNSEELLFEMYRQRNRIDSGALLLCSTGIGTL